MLEKSVINNVQRLLKKMYTWALPYTCILCGKLSDREQDLCQACFNDLPIIAQKSMLCAQGGTCYALFAYEFPIISFILDLKFHHKLTHARILGELMAEKMTQEWYRSTPLPNRIIPVPLHKQRLKERGFNQALEIARPIAKKTHLILDTQSVSRMTNTPPQMKLPAEKRKQNVKNAFVVNKDLSGETIAIIDDVVTTGATVTELRRILLKQGATNVDIWCCARVKAT